MSEAAAIGPEVIPIEEVPVVVANETDLDLGTRARGSLAGG